MAIELPELPYRYEALEPDMSAETLKYHHDKHHRAYVDKANKLLAGTEYESLPIEDILREAADGPLYDNVAQSWNHSFFWECLQTPSTSLPGKTLASELKKAFGGVDEFKRLFSKEATELFGSGWVWLVRTDTGALDIVARQGAGNPLRDGAKPLLTCDVWEHAYYLDHRNERPRYLESFWRLVNWKFVGEQLSEASGRGRSRPAIALPDAARARV